MKRLLGWKMNVELDYAPPTPWFQRKWIRRGMVGAIVLAIVAAMFLPMRGWIAQQWHRYLLVRAQEECANYVPDPHRILYSEAAGDIAALASVKGYTRVSSVVSPPAPGINYDYVFGETVPWKRLVREWEVVGNCAQEYTMSSSDPVVYLHGLKAPSGEMFFSRVERMERTEDVLSFVARTHVPLEMKMKPDEFLWLDEVIDIAIVPTPPRTKPLRFFAATADGADGMGFTMEYEVGGVKGHIRGKYVQDPSVAASPGAPPKCPVLKMEIVDGPLKM